VPRTISVITVFIASPADVLREKDIVSAQIAEWNARHGKDNSINFDVVRWETSVSAGFGSDGQDVINSQVGDQYDVLIGLFWARYGSATPRASSGTVEEYRRAFERYRSGEDVDIAFLLKGFP
jgi:hypothetical protein